MTINCCAFQTFCSPAVRMSRSEKQAFLKALGICLCLSNVPISKPHLNEYMEFTLIHLTRRLPRLEKCTQKLNPIYRIFF